jgi:hypothetical protein
LLHGEADNLMRYGQLTGMSRSEPKVMAEALYAVLAELWELRKKSP